MTTSEDTTKHIHHLGRQRHRLQVVWIVFGLSVAALAGAVFSHYVIDGEPSRWDPLGRYSVQHVLTPQVAYGGDVLVAGVVYRDGKPTAMGIKCSKEKVIIVSRYAWKTVKPIGTSITVAPYQAIREKGCPDLGTFHNQPPIQVSNRIASECGAGRLPPLWRIVGEDTPLRPDGERGESRVWTTGSFAIGCP